MCESQVNEIIVNFRQIHSEHLQLSHHKGYEMFHGEPGHLLMF
jgi:hypothetical protein